MSFTILIARSTQIGRRPWLIHRAWPENRQDLTTGRDGHEARSPPFLTAGMRTVAASLPSGTAARATLGDCLGPNGMIGCALIGAGGRGSHPIRYRGPGLRVCSRSPDRADRRGATPGLSRKCWPLASMTTCRPAY
jgi:hypothetical protein